jgi:hypothetical protein
VPLVVAAVCPHPPLLVPEVPAGAAAELDDLRAACRAAVDVLFGYRPEIVIIVGGGRFSRSYPPGTAGSLAGFGVPFPVGSGPAELPLSLTIGTWLLGCFTGEVRGRAVADGMPPAEAAAIGRELAAAPERVALLVMGDGSARRSIKAPGYLDERAEPFDMAVAEALDKGDPDALLAIDPKLAAELMVAGRAPWQVLAGAAAGTGWRGELRYAQAPYGVAYFVATWEPA